MKTKGRRIRGKKRGVALVTTFGIMTLLAMAAASYIGAATQTLRITNRQVLDLQGTHLCEAGVQSVLLNLWTPFKANQTFTQMDTVLPGASISSPLMSQSGSVGSIGNFAAGVIAYSDPGGDPYTRQVTIRAVGWIDRDHTGQLTADDPQKVVDVVALFQLSRSKVFDYTYFVNNYGWMQGFGPSDLIVNGDMRANGNFTISDGSPTINGSVIAACNNELVPAAAGLVSGTPVKWSNSTYISQAKSQPRWRQGYDSSVYGAYGTTNYANSAAYLFDSAEGSVLSSSTPDEYTVTQTLNGAYLGDVNGIRRWSEESLSSSPSTLTLDSTPTQQVVMPDLSDIATYVELSEAYVDSKQYYGDGTVNPLYGQGAYVKVWNSTTSSYTTLSTNGVVTGSSALVGTSSHPIIIHGPVTFTQDAVIKGNVSGQGTIYAGRNVHIVGSIVYTNPPNFELTSTRTTMTAVDNYNEHEDMLGLAAGASVIMGDTSEFGYYPLNFMTPPFTQGRYDDEGNWIPAYNALATDSTGNMKYESVLGNSLIHSLAQNIQQIDAVLYTNFVGGGNIGGSGTVNFNGSIISKDEAMVVWSLPMYENYDSRVRERGPDQQALIDLQLPRSPMMLQSTWQDMGFSWGSE
jgi:hypothetical protein